MAISSTHEHAFHRREITKEKADYLILVVDDDVLTRHLLGTAIRTWGYQCVEAENGRMALEKLETKPIDIVISDQQMPMMTGTEFIAELHNRYQESSPPVILMSGDKHRQLENKARELGVEAFFGKPYHMETLLHAMESIMENRKTHSFLN